MEEMISKSQFKLRALQYFREVEKTGKESIRAWEVALLVTKNGTYSESLFGQLDKYHINDKKISKYI